MTVKYASKRPAGSLDGLQAWEAHFTGQCPEDVVVVAVVSRHAITKVDPSSDWQATIRFKHVEVAVGDEADAVRAALRLLYERRTGATPLPVDELALEGDLFVGEGV